MGRSFFFVSKTKTMVLTQKHLFVLKDYFSELSSSQMATSENLISIFRIREKILSHYTD